MLDHIVQVSEAFRQGAGQMQGSLRPAMKVCPHCGLTRMIASPALGTCDDCGAEMQVLSETKA